MNSKPVVTMGIVVVTGILVAGGWFTWQSLGTGGGGRTLTVVGTSMAPTIQPGEQVRLLEQSPEEIARGDLVAIRFQTRERLMVKRVIARAGDEVYLRDGRVFVNGAPLVMEGWPETRRVNERAWKVLGIQLRNYDNRVPPNNVIVMGDNALRSYDSGDFGMLSLTQIAGRIER